MGVKDLGKGGGVAHRQGPVEEPVKEASLWGSLLQSCLGLFLIGVHLASILRSSMAGGLPSGTTEVY